MQAIRRLIVEAHRRSLWQVFTIYVAAAWAGYQIIDALPGLIGVPDWVPGMSLVLFLIGLPIVVATAFVQEGGPLRGPSEPPQPPQLDPTLLPGTVLEPAAGGGPERRGATGAASPLHIHRLFTWRRALTGGGLALLLLATSAGGYVGMRAAGWGPVGSLQASGELATDDVLILADFGNATPDSSLGDVITEALRIDLASARSVRIAEPAQIEAALTRMQRTSGARLDRELAREVAEREQLKAVIAGEVGALGSRYVLTAEMFAAADGRVIAAFRETARNADELLDATDRLSRAIRTKVGESLRSVNTSPPLERVTTRSLEALRKFTEARRAPSATEARELLTEAIALDSTFGTAYRALAALLANAGQTRASIEARTKAFQLRANMTAVERALTEADYYRAVERNRDRALRAYREALAVDPLLMPALNNAALMLTDMQRFAEAESLAIRGVHRPDAPLVLFNNLIEAQFALGKHDAMLETARLLEAAYPQQNAPAFARFFAALGEDDEARADSIATALEQREDPGAGYNMQTSLALRRGQLSRVADYAKRSRARATARGNTPGLPNILSLLERVQHGLDPAPSLRTLDSVAAVWEARNAPVIEQPLETLGYAYAVLGRPDRAKHYLDRAEARLRNEVGANPFTWTLPALRARVALAEGRGEEALLYLRAAKPPCDICIDYEAATVFEAFGQPDSAIARYRRFVTEPRPAEYRFNFANSTLATLRLAELYDARGDRDNAAHFYARVVALWANADPHLQPRVAAARHRLAELRTER